MSGSVRPPRVQPAPPPPDASMPGKKHKPVKRGKQEMPEDPFFDPGQVASATECTGILPAQAQNEEEAESVSSLEGIHSIRPALENESKKP